MRLRRSLLILLPIALLGGGVIAWQLRSEAANGRDATTKGTASATKLPRAEESAAEREAREQRAREHFHQTIESFLKRNGRTGANLVAVIAACSIEFGESYREELRNLRDDPIAMIYLANLPEGDYSAALRFHELEPDNSYARFLVMDVGLLQGKITEEEALAQLLQLRTTSGCNLHLQEIDNASHAFAIDLGKDRRTLWKEAYQLRRSWNSSHPFQIYVSPMELAQNFLKNEAQDPLRKREMADVMIKVAAQFELQEEWRKQRDWLSVLCETPYATPDLLQEFHDAQGRIEREDLFSTALKLASEEQLERLDQDLPQVGTIQAINHLIDSIDPEELQRAHEAQGSGR